MNKSERDWVELCRGYKAFLSSLRSCFGEKPSLKMREREMRKMGRCKTGLQEENREVWG